MRVYPVLPVQKSTERAYLDGTRGLRGKFLKYPSRSPWFSKILNGLLVAAFIRSASPIEHQPTYIIGRAEIVSCRSGGQHKGCQIAHPVQHSPLGALQQIADRVLSRVANKPRLVPMAGARRPAANLGDEFDLVCGEQAFRDQFSAGSRGIGREEQDPQILKRPRKRHISELAATGLLLIRSGP